jgi:hypothetical protein
MSDPAPHRPPVQRLDVLPSSAPTQHLAIYVRQNEASRWVSPERLQDHPSEPTEKLLCWHGGQRNTYAPHRRDKEIMNSDDATIIEERSYHRGADPSAPCRSPPRGVDPSFRAATVIPTSMSPPRGGFVMAVATVAMETVVATVTCCLIATAVQGANLSSPARIVGLDCKRGLKIL